MKNKNTTSHKFFEDFEEGLDSELENDVEWFNFNGIDSVFLSFNSKTLGEPLKNLVGEPVAADMNLYAEDSATLDEISRLGELRKTD